MQIEINTSKAGLLLVKVPDDVKVHHVNTLWHNDKITGNPIHIDLPQGNWDLIGNAFELTEEQCKGVVSMHDFHIGYTDYSTDVWGCIEAKQSFASLLQVNKVYTEKPDDCNNQWCDNGKIDIGYGEWMRCLICEEIEEQTGNWVVLKKYHAKRT